MRLFVGKGLLDLRETRASSSRSDPLLNQVDSRPAAVCSIERTLFMDGHLAPQLIGTAFIQNTDQPMAPVPFCKGQSCFIFIPADAGWYANPVPYV